MGFILLPSNIVIAIVGGMWVIIASPIPTWLAFICFIFGALMLVSRVLAWQSGASQHAFTVAASEPGMRNRLFLMEILVLAPSIANVSYFLI